MFSNVTLWCQAGIILKYPELLCQEDEQLAHFLNWNPTFALGE